MIPAVIFYACEKNSDNVIDVNISFPTISNLTVTPDTIFTVSNAPVVGLTASVKVTSEDVIKNVICTVINSKDSTLGFFNLRDNGSSPDPVANDGIFTGNISIEGFTCLAVGNYRVEVYAESEQGAFSNVLSKIQPVRFSNNVAPVISNLVIPDSVVRPTTGFVDITLEINASDPNGQCDINKVFLTSIRPTGFPIPGETPLFFSSGSTYKVTAPVFPSTADTSYGYFKYTFMAIDNSGLQSNIIKDSIKFVRP